MQKKRAAWQLADSSDEEKPSLQSLQVRRKEVTEQKQRPQYVACGHELPPAHCPPANDETKRETWTEALRSALSQVMDSIGRQQRPFVIQTACSGTGAPSIALEARQPCPDILL